jgi:hypothetical protein
MLDLPADRFRDSDVGGTSFRATVIIGALFALALGSAFLVHWDVIYWAKDRPRVAALVVVAVTGAIIILSQRLIGVARLPPPTRLNCVLLLAIVIAICLGLAYWSLAGSVFSGDEVTYQFQADTYRAGRLFNPVPPLGHAMGVSYVWAANGKWVGQYPPGWPSVLAAFQLLGAPAHLANAVLVVATAYVIWLLTKMRASREDAWLAVLLFSVSPFALFQGQSLFSHPLAGLLAISALFFAAKARNDGRPSDALLTGVLIGALGVTRTVAALAAIAAVLIEIAPHRKRLSLLFFVGLGGIPFTALMLAYQYLITGHALEPVYYLGGRNVDHLYFDLPSIKTALVHSFEAVFELALYTSPVMPVLWVAAIVVRARRRTLSGVDLLFPLGVGLFCFYPLHPGMRFGPRYWYDFWPAAIVTIAAGLPHLRGLGRGGARAWASSSVIYGVVCTAFLAFALRPVALDHTAVYRAAARQHLLNAVVLDENLPSRGIALEPWTFARNGIRVDGPVLFVREGIRDADTVRHAYPGRSLWVYSPPTRPGFDGVLVPVRQPAR